MQAMAGLRANRYHTPKSQNSQMPTSQRPEARLVYPAVLAFAKHPPPKQLVTVKRSDRGLLLGIELLEALPCKVPASLASPLMLHEGFGVYNLFSGTCTSFMLTISLKERGRERERGRGERVEGENSCLRASWTPAI